MFRTLTLGPAVLVSALIAGQPASIDHTFNTTDIGFGYGDGANDAVLCSALQVDGTILIGGDFFQYNSTNRGHIARLTPDGELDGSFLSAGATDGPVHSIVLQSDGRVLIGGTFTTYGMWARGGIARLETNAALDTTFMPGSGANNEVLSVALQPDGRIIIGGAFTSYNGFVRFRMARLLANGAIDGSFDPNNGANNRVRSVVLQPDGRVLIAGEFTNYDGTGRNRIARLNSDGSLDPTFSPGAGANGVVHCMVLQPDGKILVGGEFTNYAGTGHHKIVRLNADGSVDATFDPGTGANGTVRSIALRPDGKMLVGGEFTSFNGTPIARIARLNADGSSDASFSPGTGANAVVHTTMLQPDGKVLMGGDFITYDGTPINRMTRLNVDGDWDASFNTGSGANGVVTVVKRQPDGMILVGGSFLRFNGTTITRIARLHTDGSSDASFNPGAGANNWVFSILLQPDGRILIGGQFTSYDGATRNRIARLNTDGSLDATFDPGTGSWGTIHSLALQPDGQILIGGDFTTYNGTPISRIARLNTDGSLDPSFNPGTGADDRIRAITLQPDGKILIGGEFTTYNGTPINHIGRLNADGSLDVTFTPGAGASSWVRSTALQPDGKILIGGYFDSYNGTPRSRFARLNADGSLDTSFDPGTAVNGFVYSIFIQPDGRILIGGFFSAYDGMWRKNLARIDPNGSLDLSFDPGAGANDVVLGFDLQPDGGILVGGEFTSYDGTGRNRVARLNGDIGTSSGEGPGPNDVLRVFPNPTTGLVRIDHTVVGPTELFVMDSFGRVVMTRNLRSSGSPFVLDLHELAAGVYHLEMRSANPPARSTVLLQR
ncbi:MAG: hypothetical protein JNJ64_04355 [Flavobacteriales bacterium]|nr:hypothetical protein [Flavobacteriales bacterium]